MFFKVSFRMSFYKSFYKELKFFQLVCSLFGAFLITLICLPSKSYANENKNTEEIVEKVIVYNWDDYIPKSVLEDFTKETGIHVEYHTYDSDRIMYTTVSLLKGRGYDVIVPSSSLVAKLSNEGLLQSIDHKQLKNFENLENDLLNKSFDPRNRYSIPYMWGSTAIAINTDKINPDDITSWHDLWHKDWYGQLFLIDDMLEVFNIALLLEGSSLATANEDDIKIAYEKLRALISHIKVMDAEELAKPFLEDEVSIGVIWNGDAFAAQKEKPSLKYIYPKEGVNFWMDNFVIPALAQNVKNAHIFIDYMLRPDIAVRCVTEYGYATANAAAKMQLDEEIRENHTIFPPKEVMDKGGFQQVDNRMYGLYYLYWEELKLLRPKTFNKNEDE